MKTLTVLLALVSLTLFGQVIVSVEDAKSPPKAVIESGRAAQRSEPQPPPEYIRQQDTASTDTVAAEPVVTAAPAISPEEFYAVVQQVHEQANLIATLKSKISTNNFSTAQVEKFQGDLNAELESTNTLSLSPVKAIAAVCRYFGITAGQVSLVFGVLVWVCHYLRNGQFANIAHIDANWVQKLVALIAAKKLDASPAISQPTVEAAKNVPVENQVAIPAVQPQPGQSAPPA